MINNNISDIFSNLNKNISISTIACSCELNIIFDLLNVYKYINISKNEIVLMKYNSSYSLQKTNATCKTIKYIINIIKEKKKNKMFKNFNNQLTLTINISQDDNNYKLSSLKIFKNGSLQITGCVSIYDINSVINKLITIFKRELFILNNNKIQKIKLFEFKNKEDTEIKLVSLKIDMVNSSFSLGKTINRETLYELLKNQKIECRFEPTIRASVDITYKLDNLRTISIFVFENGNIIITGAKTCEEINNGYIFITNFINDNYSKIKILNSFKLLDEYLELIE